MASIGENGEFAYRIPGIRSYAMVIDDIDVLPHARMEDRHRILSLRMRPEQVRVEQPKTLPLEVHYQLRLAGEMDAHGKLRNTPAQDRYAA